MDFQPSARVSSLLLLSANVVVVLISVFFDTDVRILLHLHCINCALEWLY